MGARPHVAALSISTLPWAVGVYCAVLGAMLLVVPHQFADLWGPIASSKTTFVAIASLVGGVGLLATAVFSPSWRSIRRAHLVAGAALLVVAGSSLRATGLAAAAFHAALGLGTLLGAWWGAPPGDEDARTRPDAFAILIGVASSVFAGVALFSIVRHGSTAAIVAGVALVIAGIGFAATPFIRALHHRSLLHHGLLAFALLALAATWSLPRRSWIELTITIGFGLLVALLPRIRPWFHSHRPPQLRQRVALTLGLAAAAPLVAAITVASQREEAFVEQEELRREQLLAGQIAHETAEYVESYREAVRALAGKPQLLDVAPEQQHELLQSFAAAFPDVLVFALTDARGNITARSDDLPPFSLNDRQLFEAAKAAGTAAQTVVLLPTDPAPQIRLAAAVRDAALEFKGTVSVVMEPKHLQALLQRAWPGEKGRMYLVDDRGRVVLDPRPDGFATLADRATAPPVAAFLENPFAAGSGRFHYGSRVWYAAFTSLPHLSCGVIVERPADLVLAAAHAGRELAFGILLVAIALAAVLGLLTADRLCAPLDALTRAARRLTAGDATAQLPTSPVMEIESLSLAFGAMRESLLARTAERERAESALRASEERLRMLIEGVRDYAIFMTDRSGEILVWNAAADGVMGYRADQIVGQSFTKLYPAEAVTSGEPEQHLATARDLDRFESEGWRVRHDGSRFWANTLITALRDADGKLVAYSHFTRDRTERKRSEEEHAQLLEHAERARRDAEAAQLSYRFLTQAIPQIVWTARANGELDYFNRRWFEYSGLAVAESEGLQWQQAIHPDDLARTVERWHAAVLDGESYEIEYRLRRRDGSYRWHLARGSPERDRAGNVSKWFGTFTDIDDQKRAEESQRFLADASQVLAGSMEAGAALGEVARLAVAKFADLCAIGIRGEPGGHAPLAIREPALACMGHEPTIEPALALLSAAVLRTATARHERNVAASALGPVDGDGATAAILNAAGWRSFICVPMLVRGKPLGTITVAIVTSARSYESGDLQVVEDLGRRIALAVDNARLFSAAQESRHEAEIANHAKDEFLAVLSHELRTPLNAMIGWVHLLRRGTLDEPTFRRAIESIKTSADSQAKLIDDLTDVSRIISGKVRLNMRVLDPAPVIEAAVTAIGPTAEAKNITIVRSLDRGKAAVRADADRLQQVVWNLVSNAVKFTPEGGRVHVRFRRDGGKIEIVVSDTGKGIQRSFLPLVFDPFRQADSTTTRRHGGLGLGLAIVRNLVELHGGTVRADSPGEDQGATFTVTLPITSVPVAVPAARRPEDLVPAHEPALRNLRILVVDDELSARELLAMILEHSGAKVQLAASAQEALDLFTSFRPNVLISDIGMPDEDGYSLMRKITKLSQRGPVVPSVALTAYARTEDRLQALAAGFHVHMAKPVEPAELLAVIASLVTRPTCAIEQE